MRSEDLQITELKDGFSVTVCGRANFDYAVPLRELAGNLTAEKWLQIDLENCEAMDSTFMGVLSMIGLKARRCGAVIELVKASDFLRKLLRDLGIAKLFDFVEEFTNAPAEWTNAGGKSDLLATAETVTEAHEKLVEEAAKLGYGASYDGLEVEF